MPFALSPMRPIETGRVENFEVPYSQFLATSFEQGMHDSMFNSIMQMTEQDLERSGPMLSAEEANKRYGMEDLQFSGMTYESEARLLNERKQAEARRTFFLSQGNRDGLVSKRGLSGMGASMIGSILNPLDMGINFLPVIGSEVAAAKLGSMGAGTFRQGLAHGLISTEAIGARVVMTEAGPQVVSSLGRELSQSLIQGFVGNTVAEIPRAINAIRSHSHYEMEDSIEGILTGTAVGGALHLGLTAAARSFSRLSNSTREVMLRKAVDDFMSGRTPEVHDFVKVDENTIRDRVKFNEQVAREQAIQSVSVDDIRAAVKEKYGENITRSAMRLADGRVLEGKPGELHFMIEGVADLSPQDYNAAERGFMTDKGRFVTNEEAAAMVGKTPDPGQRLASEELHYIDPEFLTKDEQAIFEDAKAEGGTDAHGVNAVRQARRERADAAFFERPEIQQKVEEEKSRQVNDIVEKQRQSYDEEGKFKKAYREEMQRQIAEGKTLTPEQAKEWGFGTPEKAQSTLKEQATELEKELETSEADDLESTIQAMMDIVGKQHEELKSGKGSINDIKKSLGDLIGKNLTQDEYFVLRGGLFHVETSTVEGLLQAIKDHLQNEIEETNGGSFITNEPDSLFKLDAEGQIIKNPKAKQFEISNDLWETIEAGNSLSKYLRELEEKVTSTEDIATKAIDEKAKGAKSAIDEAINCLIRNAK